MWLTRLCIRYPVFTVMLMLAFVVLGTFSWNKLAVEEYPNVEFPYVVISTYYPGASPTVVESEITRPIEDAINTVAGVKRIISTSFESQSRIAIEFSLSVPIHAAVQDVRDKIAAVKIGFRADIEEPLIERFRIDEAPVFSLAFVGGDNSRELSTHVEQYVVRRLQNIEGVGRIDVVGAQVREIHADLAPERMAALGVGVDEVIMALRSENIHLPAGTLDLGANEKIVEISGRFTNPKDFENLIIAQRGRSVITLGQVASIQDGEAELQSLALLDGQRAVSLNIVKSSGSNIVSLVDRIKQQLPEIEANLPANVRMLQVADSSKNIRASLAEVNRTLIEGAILAVIIVFLFLGSWRSTIITGLTLPVALLGTIFFLNVFGLTLNNMTLMALSLSIGLLIDDAIVVRENIVRHTAMGKDHLTSALEGTREIGLAVLATTLTIVAVFLPVAFMDGIIGRFFYQFGVAVSCAVLLSMLVSFTLDPMLSSHWHDPDAHGMQGNSWLAGKIQGFSAWLDRLGDRYAVAIKWALSNRKKVAVIASTSLLIAFISAAFVGKEFVPEADMGEISVKFSTPVGSSLLYTEQKAKQISQMLNEFEEVTSIYSTINTGMDIGKHKAALRILLTDKSMRDRSQQELIAIFRDVIGRVHGITLDSVTPAKETLGSLKPIQLSLQGNDMRVLEKLASDFEKRLANVKGLIDIESSIKASRPTLALEIDRERAADLGLSVSRIGSMLRPLLAGEVVTSWQSPDGDSYDVRVRLEESKRNNQAELTEIGITSGNINPVTGQPEIIALGQVAGIYESQSSAQINRRNLYREVLFSANVSGRPAGDVGAEIEKVAATMVWPTGYKLVTQGANKDMAESVGYAITALLLGVIFIYMLLGTQFNSFLHPFTIMTSLPLSLVGVFLALLLLGSSLNMFSIIGIIMLMGLVTKNAILLVDLMQKLVGQGMPRQEAIVLAGQTRLRPILMTTAAMIAGMIPLAIGLGVGAEQRSPMAHALIGGLVTSTILTLIVVPVVYSVFDDFKRGSKQVLLAAPAPATASLGVNMIHLGDDNPSGTDYVGMWYNARLQKGIDDRMLYGVFEQGITTPHWFYAHHRHYDGLAILTEKLLPLYGKPLTQIPRGKDAQAPTFKQWWQAQKIKRVAPQAAVKWRAIFPELATKAVPLPHSFFLTEDDTDRIEFCAKAAGVSSTQWLLWCADQAVRQLLLAEDSVSSWVYPVNLRGATGVERESMNQCGGFMLTIDNDMSALALHEQVRNRMSRLEHWTQWWLMSIGKYIGQSGINFIYRRMNQVPGQHVGSYSNIGAWDVPYMDGLTAAGPCSPAYPISVTTAVCNGRRCLALRIHPVIDADGTQAEKVATLWKSMALTNIHFHVQAA